MKLHLHAHETPLKILGAGTLNPCKNPSIILTLPINIAFLSNAMQRPFWLLSFIPDFTTVTLIWEGLLKESCFQICTIQILPYSFRHI